MYNLKRVIQWLGPIMRRGGRKERARGMLGQVIKK